MKSTFQNFQPETFDIWKGQKAGGKAVVCLKIILKGCSLKVNQSGKCLWWDRVGFSAKLGKNWGRGEFGYYPSRVSWIHSTLFWKSS